MPPAPPPYPPGQQPPTPPQQDDDGLDDAALAVAVAALLLTAISVVALIAAIRIRFALSAIAWQALGAVLTFVMASPPPVTGIIGAASEQTGRMNAARRAQYVLAATRRVIVAVREARSKGQPVGDAIRAQIAREQRWYSAHQAAMWNRAAAAGKIDMEAAVYGPLLGWYAKRDKSTTADCLKADRHNFYVTAPPDIGLPGIGPHVGCRCEAGPPWPGALLLPSRGARYERAAA